MPLSCVKFMKQQVLAHQIIGSRGLEVYFCFLMAMSHIGLQSWRVTHIVVNTLHFLTLFIEHYLQGKYIFQCVNVATNSKSESRERFTMCRCRIQTWSHLSCRTALGNFIYNFSKQCSK